MDISVLISLLTYPAVSPEIEAAFTTLGTFTRPSLDENDPDQHYDWVLVRRKGLELGFVDKAYFDAEPENRWGDEANLILNQLTFYNEGVRDSVAGYADELPHSLSFRDSRQTVRNKLTAFESSRHSYLTDRWDCGHYRMVVSYLPGDGGIECVHLKMPIVPWPEEEREQPNIARQQWLILFGEPASSDVLQNVLSPLDLQERIIEGEDEREVDFIRECGIELYFEEASQLTLKQQTKSHALVLGAVKFFRARDREARQWQGELPLDLNFDDSPETLFAKLKVSPAKQEDGNLTGHALWHFPTVSLHVLYSTIENHLFRITLMAPGYWRERE
jgi:hypothetical protein